MEIADNMDVISIHAPRTGSDTGVFPDNPHDILFQSTLPARGATATKRIAHKSRRYFNPRSPHGERPRFRSSGVLTLMISIHAPRTGSDSRGCPLVAGSQGFQSTLPARGATIRVAALSPFIGISIHAPRTGSDTRSMCGWSCLSNFNPRSPHGERPRPASPRFLRR